MKLALIGDLHYAPEYHKSIMKKYDYTIQVGDCGFKYDYLKDFDSNKHKWVGGNHDNYDIARNYPHYLGDYGLYEVPGRAPIFFVRGAWSIDHESRKQYMKRVPSEKVWWEEEELSMQDLNKAIDLYKTAKPEFVISHEAPFSVLHNVCAPGFPRRFGYPQDIIKTKTSFCLEEMLKYHKPKEWVFGHYHKSWADEVNGIKFQCLDINEVKVYDI